MSGEKEPSKEALAVANSIAFPPRAFALALDAWSESILRRQTASQGVEVCVYEQVCDLHIAARDALTAERAAHDSTKAALAELGDLHDKSRALWVRNIEAEEAAHAATRAELEATRRELAGWEQSARGCRDEVLALREKLTSAEAELESLRKPLEGELAEALETVRRFVGFSSSEWHAKLLPCLARIEAALRAKGEPHSETLQALANMGHDTECGACMGVAFTGHVATEPHTCKAKGEPQAASAKLDTLKEYEELVASMWGRGCGECPELKDAYDGAYARLVAKYKGEPQAPAHQGCQCESCGTLGELSAEGLVELIDQQVTSEAVDTVKTRDAQRWLRAKVEPQTAEPPEPRPIVVGSKWRSNRTGIETEVLTAGAHVWLSGYADNWYHAEFRRAFTWVSDPEHAAPAPEPSLWAEARASGAELDEYSRRKARGETAPELPLKVEPGARVRHRVSGRTGKVTRRSDYHVGRWVIAADETFRGVDGCFADGFEALGSDLELVADAPKGKP